MSDPRLILPLDLPTRAEAEAMVETLGDAVTVYKIGLQLLATEGMGDGQGAEGLGQEPVPGLEAA